jgi:4'-phosphopantetheinyl transferase
VEVWLLDLDPAAARERLEARAVPMLDACERGRLLAFRHEGARTLFLGARLLSRVVLAGRLGISPEAIRFGQGRLGKPFIEEPWHGRGLHFNLAHSGSLVVCAVSGRGPVGVDVERMDRRVAAEDMARAHFTRAEAEWIRSGPEKAAQRFLALWTLKEACLKVTGEGLSRGLDQLSFTPCAGGRIRPSDPTLPFCRLMVPRPRYWLAVCGPGLESLRPPLLRFDLG